VFRPVSLFLGLRYTRAKRRNHFISFISLSSMLGIALGVTVLITVLSVMNGFDQEIKNRIFEFAPQITVRDVTGNIEDWQNLSTSLQKIPGVLAAAPFASGQGMLTSQDNVYPALINGVLASQEKSVSKISQKMVVGSFTDLKAGKFGIILGATLANNLGAMLGSKVTVVTPEATISPAGILPNFKRFTVVGIFHAGNGFGFDTQLAYINLKDAQALFEMNDAVTGIQLKINNLYAAPTITQKIASAVSSDYFITNWTMDYGPLFKAIQLEKTMMFCILLLIVAVAAFNLVASLVMVVNDKRADIAILRTFGASPQTIMNSFIVQGFIIGWVGTLMGLIGGVLLAYNITNIVSAIEHLFHIQLLSSSIYYVNYLPSKLLWSDIIRVCLAAFLLCLLATLYPAWRAAKTQPAEALRYE
jgi:lipoprotein-releasing system permease protein